MKRREFLKMAGGFTGSWLVTTQLPASRSGRTLPNIILIMADDFGFECLSCNGSTSYRTPHIDRLARQGVRFTHCYSTPLCTPSRVQLMTGKYNFRNYKEFGMLPKGEVTFAQVLKEAGYSTCVAGKWQLAGHYRGSNYKGVGTFPGEAGFDHYCLWQVDRLGSRYWNPLIKQNGKWLKTGEDQYGPDVVCNFIIDFIRMKQDRPFFVYYPMILTHAPFVPTPDSNVEGGKKETADKKYFPDMVAYADQLVGRIVDTLDELGLRRNTVILFTGDNGSPRAVVSRMGDQLIKGGKGTTTLAGTHVPLIVSWPESFPSGKICDDLVDFTDFFPTLLEIAGARTQGDLQLDGHSFVPQLSGKEGTPRQWVFCHYQPRWGKWKPRRFVHDKRWKLYQNGRFYDLKNDPEEKTPLNDNQLTEEAKAMKKRFEEVLQKMSR